MKYRKKKTIIITLALLAFVCNAQTLNISINRNCNRYCAPGTWLLNIPFCSEYFLMTASGATNYTWTLNNNVAATTPTLLFQVLTPGTFVYKITGSAVINNTLLYGVTTTTVIVEICDCGSYTVGIKEYEPNTTEPVYFDFMGNRIEKRFNEFIIEWTGSRWRKVVFYY